MDKGVSVGSGRRIRTLTNGVRVRCATITQFRYEQMILYRYFWICQPSCRIFFTRGKILFPALPACAGRAGRTRSAVEDLPVDRDRNDLPWQELSARAQRLPRRVLEPAAARHLHAHDGHALNVVAPDDLRELVGVIHRIELRAADERDLPFHELTVHVRVGIRRAVGRNEQLRALKIRRVDRHELDLARPLAKLRRQRRRRRCRGRLFTLEAVHLVAGAAAGVRGMCGLHLLFALVGLHGRLVIRRRFALDKMDGIHRAGGQAVAETIAVIVAQELGLAVHDADSPLVAGRRARAAAVALFFVNVDDLTDHNIPSLSKNRPGPRPAVLTFCA